MNTHVTIQEAVQETGKSVSTIRRAIKRLSKDAIQEQDGKYLIQRAALFAALGLTTQNQVSTQPVQVDSQPSQMSSQVDTQPDIVAILTEQLRIKDEQIAQLLDRQRETNILLGQLRLLTTKEAVTTGKTERELQHERLALIVAVVIVLAILAVIVWLSWR